MNRLIICFCNLYQQSHFQYFFHLEKSLVFTYSCLQRQLNSLKISALSVNSIHQLEKKMNNDHLVLSDNLKSNKINVNLSVLIDINIINYSFIDDSFMQKHSLLCFSLFEICILQKFDDQSVVFNSITHYALVKL